MSEAYKTQDNVNGDVDSNCNGIERNDRSQMNDKREGDTAGHDHDTERFSRDSRRPLATSKSLFVTGFAHAINKTHVSRLFSKFGSPERISEFMTSKKSTSRYCFVEYDSIESAQKAMDNLNGRTLLRKRLVVLPAHSKTDDTSSTRTAPIVNPKTERILIDQKIAALKKKIKESQSDKS